MLNLRSYPLQSRQLAINSYAFHRSIVRLPTHTELRVRGLAQKVLFQGRPSFSSVPNSFFTSTDCTHLNKSPISKMSYSVAPESSGEDVNIGKILTYWFETIPHQYWFQPPENEGKAMDDDIRSKFGELVETARETDQLDEAWTQTPRGSLALILLLDQFPRNIYRGSGLSFASDIKAQRITAVAIANGFDKEIASQPGGSKFHSMFFYLPLMHAEDLVSQIACVSLLENLAIECQTNGNPEEKEIISKEASVNFAKRHLECIKTLGRFPKRNEWLGRGHREDEKKWLQERPNGF